MLFVTDAPEVQKRPSAVVARIGSCLKDTLLRDQLNFVIGDDIGRNRRKR